jgi:subtilase family serine protease
MARAVDRIFAIDNSKLTRMQGSLHPMARTQQDLGSVDGSMKLERMKLVFQPTAAQQASLETLLAQQQDPNSPNYHKWLTPEQYANRFGMSVADFNKAAQWLRSQGFTISEMSRGRTYIAFDGTAAQVEASLHTQIHQYSKGGELHFANASEPALPSALASVVRGVASLNNFQPRPKSRIIKPNPRVTSSVTGNHFMQPGDFAVIYDLTGLYNSGIDGTGQKIAVMGQTDLVTDTNGNFTDIATFRTNSGLSAPNITTVLVSSDPGIVSADIDEASLDVEWAGGVAKNASIIYVIGNPSTGNGTFDALPYAVSHNLAPVISISYGLCEPQLDSATQNLLVSAGQQANAQGQTIIAPAGDGGAADCDSGASATHGLAVDFPASMPYATSAGGTEFTGDTANSTNPCTATTYWSGGACTVQDTGVTALSYIPETVWNDTAIDGVISAGGGGVSTLFTKPSWQTGIGVPNDGQRDVPDFAVSASADHDGYLICSQGSCVCGFRNSCTISTTTTQGTFDSTGGTSASVPVFAAIVALINQKTGVSQGNVNPTLYALATSTPTAFHDITTGNNIVPCTIGTTGCPASTGGQIGYSAGPGYDLASGLGSIDGGAMVAAWSGTAIPTFTLTPASSSLSVDPGNTVTDVFTVAPVNGFTGTVALTCSVASALGSTSCTINPTSVTTSGTATVTITAGSAAATGAVTVTGTSGNLTQSVPLSVTISSTAPSFVVSAATSSLTLTSGSSGTDTLTVTPSNGFTGNVALTCVVSSTLGSTTCSINPTSVAGSGTATLTVHAATLSSRLEKRTPLSPGDWGMSGGFLLAAVLLVPRKKQDTKLRRQSAWWSTLLGIAVICLLLFTVSCGGGGGGGSTTTPLNGTVTVTGTGGGLISTATINVTVN